MENSIYNGPSEREKMAAISFAFVFVNFNEKVI